MTNTTSLPKALITKNKPSELPIESPSGDLCDVITILEDDSTNCLILL